MNTTPNGIRTESMRIPSASIDIRHLHDTARQISSCQSLIKVKSVTREGIDLDD